MLTWPQLTTLLATVFFSKSGDVVSQIASVKGSFQADRTGTQHGNPRRVIRVVDGVFVYLVTVHGCDSPLMGIQPAVRLNRIS